MVRRSAQDVASETSALPALPEEDVTAFTSFEDAISYFNNGPGVVSAADVVGDGYSLTRDKEELVNVPFLIIDWNEVTDPESQRSYASIRLITTDSRKLRLNDGSTGIYKQLVAVRDRTGITSGIAVKKGLFKSDFWVDADGQVLSNPDKYDGPKTKASTYYINQA